MNSEALPNHDNSNKFWQMLKCSIIENDLEQFKLCVNEKDLSDIRPRFINEAVRECQKNEINGCEFLEILMKQLYIGHCYFECWQETCKCVVRQYIKKSKQFTPYTIYFLLRCYDINLTRLVFERELLDEYCKGDCQDWHLMFVASYQERFSAHCFDNILEGFISRFILLCKLRCSLTHKRTFLTWFCGSLHLYTEEYILNKDEGRFRVVLIKIFEALVLNGLINNEEYKNLYEMLTKRQTLAESSTETIFPNVNSFYPLSLKNWCRLTIKRSMSIYTRTNIDKLSLPANLKRFIFFDHECENAIKYCTRINNNNDDNQIVKHCETQTDN
jgi:hypothetical protein